MPPELFLLIVGGLVAGTLAGTLGTGGAPVPAFAFLLKTPIKAAAASPACFCCNSAVSAGFKYAQGSVDPHFALPLSLGARAGANLGALINRCFPPPGLKLLFGLVFAAVSTRFLLAFAG